MAQHRDDLDELLNTQRGVISRKQAIECGLTSSAIEWLISTGRWQTLQRGVYWTFNSVATREASLWAALLRAGHDAVLSHQTAAELFKLADQPSSLIHVTVSGNRHVAKVGGLVIHRSTRLEQARHPVLLPPRTRVEETVLDLVEQAQTFRTAFGVAVTACQRRLTRADLLIESIGLRKKLRWRSQLYDALSDIGDGVHSMLEFRYVRGVERPHGLPRATRQARVSAGRRTRYVDNDYDAYGVRVELDGMAFHPDDQRWQDIHRDNESAAEGSITLRYTWPDVIEMRCRTALQIGSVLSIRGWPGQLAACGPHCAALAGRAA